VRQFDVPDGLREVLPESAQQTVVLAVGAVRSEPEIEKQLDDQDDPR
jgi:hypothetical protein